MAQVRSGPWHPGSATLKVASGVIGEISFDKMKKTEVEKMRW